MRKQPGTEQRCCFPCASQLERRELPAATGRAAHYQHRRGAQRQAQAGQGARRRRADQGGVKKLALPAGKSDVIFWDSSLPGFGLRIRAGGKRTWVAQFRDGSGATRRHDRQRRHARGGRRRARRRSCSAAWRSARTRRRRRRRGRPTKFGDLVEQFLAYAQGPAEASTHEATTRNLEVHAKPLTDRR